jgi:hypothetical protein
MTTKKSAPATGSDQGKKSVSSSLKNNKSPAASQENSQKPLSIGIAKEFIRLKAENPQYIPTNQNFQKAWSEFETQCKDVGVTSQNNINDFENRILKAIDTAIKKDLQATPEPEQTVFGFIPTELTRVSWFRCLPRPKKYTFPLPGESNQKIVFEQQTFKTKWGFVTFLGPDGIGYDVEDLLIILLRLWELNDRTEYTIELSKILDLLGFKRTSQKRHQYSSYKKLQRMLRILSVSSFAVGLDNKEVGWSNEPIIFFRNRKYNYEIKIGNTFDRYFRQGLMTGINIKERIALKKDVAKGLYRFISSHRDNSGQHNIISVAQAIGMDTNQPIFKIRQTFKKAIAELKKKTNLLDKRRNKNTIKDDILIWTKSKPVLSGPKLLRKINPNHQIDV